MPYKIADNTAIITSTMEEVHYVIPKSPFATIKQLTQVEHMGARD